jgi:Tetratricopeptide repeat
MVRRAGRGGGVLRVSLTCTAVVVVFFGTWAACQFVLHMDRDVALALAALADVIVLVPLGIWIAAGLASGHDGAGPTTPRMPIAPEQIVVGNIPRAAAALQPRRHLLEQLVELGRIERAAVIAAVTGARGVGKTQLAAAYARDLLPTLARVLGPDHPTTLRARNNLALVTGLAGQPAAARDLYHDLLPTLARVLGPDHPATLTARNNLDDWTRIAAADIEPP